MSTGVIKTFRKTSVERRRLYLDYSCWLEDVEELTDFQITVTPYTDTNPIVVSSGYTDDDHKKLTLFVSGGVPNTKYTLSMVTRTDAGQIKRDDIGMMVTT
jgi:hypothetical protein